MSKRRTLFIGDFSGGDTADIGSMWDSGYTGLSDLKLVSQRVRAATTVSVGCYETVNSPSVSANQWAMLRIATLPTDATIVAITVFLRATAPATWTGYVFEIVPNPALAWNSKITRVVAGVDSVLVDENVVVWANGDYLLGTVEGYTLTLWRLAAGGNPVSDAFTQVLTWTDVDAAKLSSGRPGMKIYIAVADETLGEIDSFTAGDFGITPTFCCGFECGDNGSNFLNHWAWVTSSTAPAIETTIVRTGLRALRFTAAGATEWVTFNGGPFATDPSKHVGRIYVWFVTLPSADCALVAYNEDNTRIQVRFKSSDSKIYAANGTTFGATGIAVTTGQWYRLDYLLDNTAGTADVQVDGVAAGQATGGTGANSAVEGVGFLNAITGDMVIDDVVACNTVVDYPIGPGEVRSFVPNRDGNHTCTGSNIVKGTIATPTLGPSITAIANVAAYNAINARPLGGGHGGFDLINQALPATEYVEVGFEQTDPTSPAPRAVEVITVDQQATTASGGFSTKVVDEATEAVLITRSAAGVVTDRFVRAQYAVMPADGMQWTLARFNNLRARFGYSGDATPDQYWRGIMIEAEFPPRDVETIKSHSRMSPSIRLDAGSF